MASPPSGYRIREAARRDRDLLAEMFRAFVEEQSAWGGMFGVESGPHDEYSEMFDRVFAAEESSDWTIRIAETEAGSPVGFLMATFSTRPDFFHEASRGKIEDAWVRPEHRRSGIARALALEALGWVRSRGAGRVILQVAGRNAAGQAFWRRLGFEPFMDVMEMDVSKMDVMERDL